MWGKVIIFLLLSSVAFAQNTTNQTQENATIILPYKWMGEIYGIVANETIWCKEIHDIDMIGAKFNCQFYEDKMLCMCSTQLPANVTPGYFIGLQQIENRYRDVVYSKDKEIWNLTGWIELLIAYFIISVIIVLYIVMVYPKTLTEV